MMGLFCRASSSLDAARLARLERKLDLILEHLGAALPEEDALQEVRDLVAAGPGNKMLAIKRYRELTGAGLYDAKQAVDEMARRAPR